MARTNKYASLNFNDIYEKKITNNPANKQHSSSPSASLTSPNKTILSNSRIHGNMLVLNRPSPKPIPQPSPPPPPLQHTPPLSTSDQTRFEPDSISLRPLGRTGSGPSLPSSPLISPIQIKDNDLSVSPKTNRFVPPHLRPGFLGREEKPGPEFQKQAVVRSRELTNRQGYLGSPNLYGEDGRPKSGGGYERMGRGFDSDLVEMNRPTSSGTRRNSNG